MYVKLKQNKQTNKASKQTKQLQYPQKLTLNKSKVEQPSEGWNLQFNDTCNGHQTGKLLPW